MAELTDIAREAGAFIAYKDGAYGNFQAGGVVFNAKEWEKFCSLLAALSATGAEDAVLLDLLRRARPYVKAAATSYYDGTDGAAIRASAARLFEKIDAAIQPNGAAGGGEVSHGE